MKHNVNHLEKLFLHMGYFLSFEDRENCHFCFCRIRSGSRLFQRLEVMGGVGRLSKKVDAWSAKANVSVVPGKTAIKGLVGGRLITGLPYQDAERGWSYLRDDSQMIEWNVELSKKASSVLDQVEVEYGERLLCANYEILRCGNAYASCYYDFGAKGLSWLEGKLTGEKKRFYEKNKLATGVPTSSGKLFNQIALAVILEFEDVVEGSSGLNRANLPDNRPLLLRIQVLASKLANEPGWEQV